nr:NUDIX domain-containing protein [uncultured Flavobacterium sp.]
MNTITIASAMILNKKNEILLVRKKDSTYFQLPGGKIKTNETIIETLQRELQEEINLSVKEKNCVFLGNHQTEAVNEKNTIVIGNLFEVIDTNIDSIKIQNEIEEMVWLNASNYNNYKWAHLAEEFILPIWLKKQKL